MSVLIAPNNKLMKPLNTVAKDNKTKYSTIILEHYGLCGFYYSGA